jgi:hypothetical protein
MRLSVISLIIANCVPLFGIFLFDWNLFDIMFLYWLESAVIGFYSLLKLIQLGKILALFLVPFFIFHFGMFMMGHLIFIFFLFSSPLESRIGLGNFPTLLSLIPLLKTIWVPITILFVSHGVSYVSNFIYKKEYTLHTLKDFMVTPYKRIMLLHVTLIAGGFLMILFQSPKSAAALLIILKIVIDVRAHIKEHAIRPLTKAVNY